jgi:uncharacterized membrane protein
MTFTILIVVAHVFGAIAMVAGILARELTRMQMRRTNDFDVFLGLLVMVGRFDTILARPSSLVVALTGILLAWLQGYPLLGFLQGGQVNWLLVSNLLVISVILLIGLVFVPQGRQFEAILEDAKRKGEITPELRAEDARPLVVWAHRWENIAVALVVFLMIAKPF